MELEHKMNWLRRFIVRQGPISTFLHYNALINFQQDTDFHEAVTYVGKIRGAKSYLDYNEYLNFLDEKRITDRDLRIFFEPKLQEKIAIFAHALHIDDPFWLFKAILILPEHKQNYSTIRWQIKHSLHKKIGRFHLKKFSEKLTANPRATWLAFDPVMGNASEVKKDATSNYYLLHLWKELNEKQLKLPYQTDNDIDFTWQKDKLKIANELSYQFFSTYFDEGICYWPLNDEGSPLLATFLEVYVKNDRRLLAFLNSLSLSQAECKNWNILLANLLPRFVDRHPDENRLISAVAKDIMGYAALTVYYESQGKNVKLSELVTIRFFIFCALELDKSYNLQFHEEKEDFPTLLFNIYLLLLHLGIDGLTLHHIKSEILQNIMCFLIDFNRNNRSHILQCAYENNYYEKIAIAIRSKNALTYKTQKSKISFNAIFCIDDREESFRRYLEEIDHSCVTHGFAGFFNIDILFKQIGDDKLLAMCPPTVTPTKILEERLSKTLPVAHHTLNMVTTLRRFLYRRSKPALDGTILHLSLMIPALITDLLRFLPKGLYNGLIDTLYKAGYENSTKIDIDSHVKRGDKSFSYEELANKAINLFKTIALDEHLSRLVFVVGHGSSSVNNPHLSAYNCAACSSKKGGANARIFATICNNKKIREIFKEKGYPIPEETFFIGAYHDTCSGDIFFYDEKSIPNRFYSDFLAAKKTFGKASKFDAQEKARRFQSIPFCHEDKAFNLVKSRSQNYAEPRAEYGHAGNALSVIGSRRLTKGIFLDRRSFLVTYEESKDPDGSILAGILAAAIPVCSGVSLDYYFGRIDNEIYGSGSKLPQNILGLVGVVTGFSSDLRTGLSWQMVELHEPMRLLTIVEASFEKVESLRKKIPHVFELIENHWCHLALYNRQNNKIVLWEGRELGGKTSEIQIQTHSHKYHAAKRGFLDPCIIGVQ